MKKEKEVIVDQVGVESNDEIFEEYNDDFAEDDYEEDEIQYEDDSEEDEFDDEDDMSDEDFDAPEDELDELEGDE